MVGELFFKRRGSRRRPPTQHRRGVGGIYRTVMDEHGALVVPADLCERTGLQPGRKIVFIVTASGVLLLTREQLLDAVRSGLQWRDLVGELLAARRTASAAEDA